MARGPHFASGGHLNLRSFPLEGVLGAFSCPLRSSSSLLFAAVKLRRTGRPVHEAFAPSDAPRIQAGGGELGRQRMQVALLDFGEWPSLTMIRASRLPNWPRRCQRAPIWGWVSRWGMCFRMCVARSGSGGAVGVGRVAARRCVLRRVARVDGLLLGLVRAGEVVRRRHRRARGLYPRDLIRANKARFVIRHLGAGDTPPRRVRTALAFLVSGRDAIESMRGTHCVLAGDLARRLGLGDPVRAALGEVFERWDGRGDPGLLAGAAIGRPARLVQFADVLEVFHGVGESRRQWRWRVSAAERSSTRASLSAFATARASCSPRSIRRPVGMP